MTDNRRRVLVLDGNENQAVACVRSLARAGHTVWVGSESVSAKAAWSRHASGHLRHAPVDGPRDAFMRDILLACRRQEIDLIMAMTEGTTLALSESRDDLRAVGIDIVLPSHDIVLRAFDKRETARLATGLGIRIPVTHSVPIGMSTSAIDVDETTAFVVKPASSTAYLADGTLVRTGAPLYASGRPGLARSVAAIHARGADALVQEFVEGAGVGYFALVNNGDVVAEFAHRRIRDVRATGSGSSCRVGIEVPEALGLPSRGLLKALAWHGVAMVEYRWDGASAPCFLEVNGRFWNSLSLAVASGADFPAWLADLASGHVPPALPAYRSGVVCRWWLGELQHLVSVLRGPPDDYPIPYPGIAKTVRAVLTPIPGAVHDNFQLADPLPELGDWLNVIRRARRRAR